MSLKQKIREVRRWLTVQFFIFTCWQIIIWLPRRRWYWGALSVSRTLVRCGGWLAPAPPNVTRDSLVARLLHRILDLMFTRRTYFPVPTIVEGEELMQAFADEPGGFVCCAAHVPLIKLFFPLIRRAAGGRELRVLTRAPVGENQVAAWNDESLPALFADSSTLLHVRSLLRNGGCLLLLIDKEQGEAFSSNIFRFVGKMQSRVIATFSQLQPDGTILLRFMLPPGPRCRGEEEIGANLGFISQNVRRILRGDPIQSALSMAENAFETKEEAEKRDLQRIQLYTDEQLKTRIARLETLMESQPPEQRARSEQRLRLLRTERRARSPG